MKRCRPWSDTISVWLLAAVACGFVAAATPVEGRGKRAAPAASEPVVAAPTPTEAAPVTDALAAVRSWGYQLKNVRTEEIARSPYDLAVIDYASGGKGAKPFTRAEVQRMQRRPDGTRRLIFAYLSIGEAESYRWYWNKAWTRPELRPPWLGEENDNWRDNHLVRFWHPEWKRIVYEGAGSYLDQILAAGFDGVYLDRADVCFHWRGQADTGIEPVSEMVAFVEALSQTAKVRAASAHRRAEPFYIIAQNAEELFDHPRYRAAIDGIAKEDLFYGLEGDEEENIAREIAYSTVQLGRVRAAGKAVLVVEYARSPEIVEEVRGRIEQLGFLPFFGPRSLEWLAVPPGRAARAGPAKERRIALVIANSDYVSAVKLASPPGDAKAIGSMLRRLGFDEVAERSNLGLRAMRAELKAFGERAKSADWAAIFYLGHAFEHDGTNYLAPVDARLTEEQEADEQALPLRVALDKLVGARKMGLLVLDASRDLAAPEAGSAPAPATGNGIASIETAKPEATDPPPVRLETGRGLAPIEPPRRVLIASAAKHSTLSEDAGQPHSAFIAAFLAEVAQPEVEIGALFRAVRRSVVAATGGVQVPTTYSALPIEAFLFLPPGRQLVGAADAGARGTDPAPAALERAGASETKKRSRRK
jgi:cysteinyl-tRNA synthetase